MTIHKSPLARVSFTADGRYLYGMTSQCSFRYPETHTHLDYSDARNPQSLPNFQCQFKDVLIGLSHSALLIDKSTNGTPELRSTTPSQQLAPTNSRGLASVQHDLAAQSTGAVQLSRRHNGAAQVSILRDIGSQGALVLQSARKDGTQISETLTRIPEDMISSSSATIIAPNSTGSEETVRIVLNKTYSTENSGRDFEATSSFHLPAILERTRSTIPTFISRSPLPLEESSAPPQNRHANARRKRWKSSGGMPRKRAKRHHTKSS